MHAKRTPSEAVAETYYDSSDADRFYEHVWGGDYDPFSNVADVYIGYLRRRFRDAGLKRPIIHTVRGMGYMLKDRRDPGVEP